MELDFDKEIDAILRKAHRDAPVFVGDFAAPHLDADAISAFAENAMPEKSRALYLAHMADCERCRKILSNVLAMNSVAMPETASPNVITIAERSIPWYRKLFLFPNLAYVMGSLVLVFSGFLAYTVVRNSGFGDAATVSQVSEPERTRGGPNFQNESELPLAESAANAAANAATMPMAANSNSASMAMTSPSPNPSGPRAGESNFVTDGLASTDSVAGAQPAPPPPVTTTQPAPKDVADRDDVAKAKSEDKVVGNLAMQEQAKNDALLKNAPNVSQSGPMRNNESQYGRQLENMDRKSAKRAELRDAEESGRRVVSGKTFERKQGVWYDTTYQGRPTINVRRGTPEFNRLEGQLRSIANSFNGTIVVVWGAKAYRIQ